MAKAGIGGSHTIRRGSQVSVQQQAHGRLAAGKMHVGTAVGKAKSNHGEYIKVKVGSDIIPVHSSQVKPNSLKVGAKVSRTAPSKAPLIDSRHNTKAKEFLSGSTGGGGGNTCHDDKGQFC